MKDIENNLNKKCLLINKKTLTDRHSPIIRKGKNFYILRKLYVLTKDNLNNDTKNKKIFFYLKTNKRMKKDIFYSNPLDDDIIIENYHSLIMLIINFCELKEVNNYKIYIFNSNLNSIEGNEQLLNYKDRIIYAKIKNNIKKNENEKNNSFRTINNILNKRILSINQRDDKGNIINNSNKSIFSSARTSFLFFKPKKNSNINNNVDEKSFRSNITKNTSFFSAEKNKNNTFNNKLIFKKKLNRISLKYTHNSFVIDKDMNDTNNNSYKISSNQFTNLIKSKNKINKKSGANFYNDSFIKGNLNKSKSELEFLREKNQKINQKIFDAEKLFNSFDNSKNESVQIMDIDKTFNKRRNYLYNNFFNNVIKNHNYSAFLKKDKNKSIFDFRNKKGFYTNNLPEEIKKKKINKTIFNQNFFDIKSQQFTNLKTIFKYLKYPKLKSIENNESKKEKNLGNISLNKLKEVYDESLYEIGNIINNINDYFPDLNDFIQQFEFSFLNEYKYIDIYICLKQYLLYCFIESFISNKKGLSLISFKNLFNENDSIIKDTYKNAESFLKYLLDKIIETRENKNFNLINFIQSKKNIEDFIISKDFFFSFILCSNFFDKMQREIGKRMLLTLELGEKLNYKNYFNYYLYFKDNRSLNLENKLNFINKFLYIVDSGCYEIKDPKIIKKFGINVQFIFRIDDRTKQLLQNSEQKNNMTYSIKKKINNSFYSMINFFGNNFFNINQIIGLN